jgi:hypothetical protein
MSGDSGTDEAASLSLSMQSCTPGLLFALQLSPI